jgi:hypothetical protein
MFLCRERSTQRVDLDVRGRARRRRALRKRHLLQLQTRGAATDKRRVMHLMEGRSTVVMAETVMHQRDQLESEDVETELQTQRLTTCCPSTSSACWMTSKLSGGCRNAWQRS